MKEGILFVINLKKKSNSKINFLSLICRISADQLHCQEEPKFMVDLDMTFSLQVRNAMKIINKEISPFFFHLVELKVCVLLHLFADVHILGTSCNELSLNRCHMKQSICLTLYVPSF